MDIGTIIGLVVAVVAVCASALLAGQLGSMIDPMSIMVVIGGTAGAVLACFPLARILKVHAVAMKALFWSSPDPKSIIADLVKYAEIARREGILSLENHVANMNDPFIVRGIKMAVDGTDPDLIKTIMETEIEAMMDRHSSGKYMLDTMGRLAPAFGMIGTLMGLIMMLNNMDDPSAIGPGMAVALITTLYGAMIANMITGPLAEKLAARASEEVLFKTIIMTGVMSIQSGDNPRVVQSKLLTFLPPSLRESADKEAA
ncbi:MAG: MotA/TolQ/ExbB proton channel family protein [Phycisphaeraceae bacterium]|nr:MotA/TolQ/ExbB proton channel family protein [Phycisphaerales bacterium]MCB9861680.1 MotA/TolQ/ExbB proton channel family protein [Phycisphaeraceae bacterium]